MRGVIGVFEKLLYSFHGRRNNGQSIAPLAIGEVAMDCIDRTGKYNFLCSPNASVCRGYGLGQRLDNLRDNDRRAVFLELSVRVKIKWTQTQTPLDRDSVEVTRTGG